MHFAALAPGERKLKLLGTIRGKTTLELGCGGGQNTIALAKQGAIASGIDLSEEQIHYAKELAKRERVRARFYIGSMDDLGRFRDETVDLAISSFAMAYIKDLTDVFREVSRVVKRGGTFVFSDTHPLVSAGQLVRRNRSQLTLRIVDYFRQTSQSWYWPPFDDGTTARFNSHHRTVQDYFDLLITAGFSVERIIEPKSPENVKSAEQLPCSTPVLVKDLSLWTRVPYSIIFRAKKN